LIHAIIKTFQIFGGVGCGNPQPTRSSRLGRFIEIFRSIPNLPGLRDLVILKPGLTRMKTAKSFPALKPTRKSVWEKKNVPRRREKISELSRDDALA
jgi:hypothetical protein